MRTVARSRRTNLLERRATPVPIEGSACKAATALYEPIAAALDGRAFDRHSIQASGCAQSAHASA